MFLIAFSVLVILLLFLLFLAINHNHTAAIVAIGFFCLIYLGRPLTLLFGAETVTPENLSEINLLGAKAAYIIVAFIVSAFVAFLCSRLVAVPLAIAVFPSRISPTSEHIFRLVGIAFALVSLVGIFVLFYTYGSAQNIISASKIDKALAGTFVIRQLAGLGAFFCLSLSVNSIRKKGSVFNTALLLLGGSTCLLSFLLWGTRLEVFVLLAGFGYCFAVTQDGILTSAAFLRIVALAVLFLVVATALYILRLYQLSGSWEIVFRRDLMTIVAISLHMIRFDALMLVIQDFWIPGELRNGEDFLNGILIAVPRFLWVDKPDSLLIGQWFRQYYEERAVNGWAIGAPGEYLLNFGFPGVIAGGAIYGFMLRVLESGYRRLDMSHPVAILIVFICVLIVFPEGSIIQIIPRIVLWIVPIWSLMILGNYMDRLRAQKRLSS